MDERIGILGGTFDPVHIGHLLAARDAGEALDRLRVIFVPTAIPPHKLDREISPAKIRMAMLQLAIRDQPAFAVSDVELRREGPSFSIDTVEVLKGDLPGSELFFLIGRDNLRAIRTWKEPGRLFSICIVVLIGRPGSTPPAREDDLPGPARTLDIHRTKFFAY